MKLDPQILAFDIWKRVYIKWCLFASLMFFWDIRILWITFTSLGEELWRWIDWNLVPSPAILTGLPMGRAGQMASKQKEQWCHDRLGSHVAVFCCGTRSLDTAKTQMLGSRYGAGLSRYGPGMVQLGVSHHDRLEIPFCMPRIPGSWQPAKAWEACAMMHEPITGCEKPVLPWGYPIQHPNVQKDTEKPWKTQGEHPMNIPSFSMALNHMASLPRQQAEVQRSQLCVDRRSRGPARGLGGARRNLHPSHLGAGEHSTATWLGKPRGLTARSLRIDVEKFGEIWWVHKIKIIMEDDCE